MKKPTVYIVTAVHNSLSHTKRFLNCCFSQDYKQINVVVLDDGSTDGTDEYISKNYPKVQLIRGTGNLWWTGGVNRAISSALKIATDSDYILTINNDCQFDKNYLQNILNTSQELNDAIISSFELDQSTKKVTTGYLWMNWNNGVITNSIEAKRKAIPVNTFTTKGTLFPVKTIEALGLLDEKHLPHYASDIEYGLRAHSIGLRAYVDSRCKVYCDTSRTGLAMEDPHKLGMKKIYSLLFSRKSTVNILDQFWLITLRCPNNLKMKNYLRIITKMLYTASFSRALLPFRKLFR